MPPPIFIKNHVNGNTVRFTVDGSRKRTVYVAMDFLPDDVIMLSNGDEISIDPETGRVEDIDFFVSKKRMTVLPNGTFVDRDGLIHTIEIEFGPPRMQRRSSRESTRNIKRGKYKKMITTTTNTKHVVPII